MSENKEIIEVNLTIEEKIEALKKYFEEFSGERLIFAKCEDGKCRLISLLP